MAREMKSKKGGGAGKTEALKKCWQNALAGTRSRDPQGAGRGGPDNQARFLERKRPPVPVPPFMATPTSGGNTPCAQPARREPPIFGPNMGGEGAGRVDTERGDHKIAGDRVESGRGHGGRKFGIEQATSVGTPPPGQAQCRRPRPPSREKFLGRADENDPSRLPAKKSGGNARRRGSSTAGAPNVP